MKDLYKQKREQGFTIIEVMIVLAIAAVILLIVLLAVPALQRNSRNTQRSNDVATIAAAINTCLANHNNVTATCSSVGSGNVDIDYAKLGQITNASGVAGCTASTTSACWTFGQTCNAAGTALQGGTAREFGILYQFETTGAAQTRCVAS
ncbi:MAG TPA: type II secretion system protein [Candidatus Saccharimonadales bacterium]|nr:type II secretion system protein [Candidatus Saccharimonadales bacterium]